MNPTFSGFLKLLDNLQGTYSYFRLDDIRTFFID